MRSNTNKYIFNADCVEIITRKNQHIIIDHEGLSKNNSSGVKGVYYNKDCNKWVCQITLNGKTIYGGLFDNLEMAFSKRKSLEEKYYQIYRR